jgi:hypothetical protein
MAFNYTGDPDAAEAPSAAPDLDENVILHIPEDGDAFDIADLLQPFKAIANFMRWVTRYLKHFSGSGDGTATPTPATTPHQLYGALIPVALGCVDDGIGTAVFNWGVGVASVAHVSTGRIRITLNNALANTARAVVQATADAVAVNGVMCNYFWNSSTELDIYTTSTASGTPTNKLVSFVVWAS